MLKQELARLRAGSNGSAAPAALDKGERQLREPVKILSCCKERQFLSTVIKIVLSQPHKIVPTRLLDLKLLAAALSRSIALHACAVVYCNTRCYALYFKDPIDAAHLVCAVLDCHKNSKKT